MPREPNRLGTLAGISSSVEFAARRGCRSIIPAASARGRDLRLGALTIALLLLAAPAHAAEHRSIIAYICKAPTASVEPWKNTVSRAIARALATSDGAHVSVRGEAECGSTAVEIACVAEVYEEAGPILSCSPALCRD